MKYIQVPDHSNPRITHAIPDDEPNDHFTTLWCDCGHEIVSRVEIGQAVVVHKKLRVTTESFPEEWSRDV